MKRKALRCYIYTRVSTDRQVEGYSLDAQQERLEKEAQHREMQVVACYSDEGRSGKNVQGRPAFVEMLERIQNNNQDNINYVLVYKLSRFGRNAADVLSSLQLMQDYGVNLLCVEDGIDSSKDAGKLMISVISAVAEIERENIRAQTLLGRIEKARQGKWNGGFAPYGYALKNGELVIAEDEAVVIRQIFNEYNTTDHGTAYIAKMLNNLGIKKKVRQNGSIDSFSANFVRSVIQNPVYKGCISFGRRRNEKIDGTRREYHVVRQKEYDVYPGIHEALVSEKEWEEANEKLHEQARTHPFIKKYSLEHEHVLSGILKCPVCNSGMYGTVNRKKRKAGGYYPDAFYYVCKHRKLVDGHHCTYNHQPSQSSIDNEVYAILGDAFDNPYFAMQLQEIVNARTDDSELKIKMNALKKARHQYELKKSRLEKEIDALDVDDEFYDAKYEDLKRRHDAFYLELAKVDSQILEMQDELDTVYSAEATMKSALEEVKMMKERIHELSDADKKAIVGIFINSVEIFPEKQEDGRRVKAVHFNIPMLLNGEVSNHWWYNEKHAETVVLMSRK